MSSTQLSNDTAREASGRSAVPLRFEVTVLPVADVDRAKAFYHGLGWRLDADFPIDDRYRIVQFTPPGSSASIQFGLGATTMIPGSMRDMYLIVDDITAARADLIQPGRRRQRDSRDDDVLVPLVRVKRILEVLRAPTDRKPRWEHQRHNLQSLEKLANCRL